MSAAHPTPKVTAPILATLSAEPIDASEYADPVEWAMKMRRNVPKNSESMHRSSGFSIRIV